jgi:hypothetical protein
MYFQLATLFLFFLKSLSGQGCHIGEIVKMQGWDENHLNF